MRERVVRRSWLVRALEAIPPHPSPVAKLEQYTIPADLAADILFLAAFTFGDVEGKRVLDLGCGTGRLAIGAAILGAREALGVDLDEDAVEVAADASRRLGVADRTFWAVADIGAVRGRFDTAIQNPPFGVRRRGADRPFLAKAIETCSVVYSLHKSGEENRHFLRAFIEGLGGRITHVIPMRLRLPATLPSHERRFRVVAVDLYRIETGGDRGSRQA